MSEEKPDEPFVPKCARCVYYGEVGINDAGYKAQFLMRPERGIGSEETEESNVTWRVGVCATPA